MSKLFYRFRKTQNIFDFKEFNYQDFRDAFKELFKVAGYEAHYKKMIKI